LAPPASSTRSGRIIATGVTAAIALTAARLAPTATPATGG
jgi:hypothetical protein